MAEAALGPIIRALRMGADRFIYGLEKVPDDRLTWAPAEGVKTPLILATTICGFFEFITYVCKEGAMPERGADDPTTPTREEAQAAVRKAADQTLAFLESATAADLEKLVPSPMGTQVPVLEMVGFIPVVIGYFQGQLNYIQTCYGDKDPNIPPSWFPPKEEAAASS